MVVSRSLAIFERSRVIPIITNISTASRVSIDCPARTRSFMRLTMKTDIAVQSPVPSHVDKNRLRRARQVGVSERGDIVSDLTPSAISAEYAVDELSMA